MSRHERYEQREPYYADDSVRLYHGDALEVLRSLDADSIDAVVTDPPYGLEFMGEDWDAPWEERGINADATFNEVAMADGYKRLPRSTYTGSTNPHCRNCGGRQRGRRDGTALIPTCMCDAPDFPNVRAIEMRAFQQWCEQWAREVLRVLKPGGHLLAFGGARTVHRLTCAIEDAGFEIRDGIDWINAGGFPKSLDVSKAIDKAKRRDYVFAAIELGLSIPGNNLHDWTKAEHSPGDEWWERFKRHLPADDWQRIERAVIAKRDAGKKFHRIGAIGIRGGEYEVTAPATDDARRWSGWGTALKPAREPIVVARKPVAGTVAANVLAYGTGALNIDGCRIPAAGRPLREAAYRLDSTSRATGSTDTGRWPTNLALSHAGNEVDGDLCADGCVPGCPVAELDRQSGILTSGANPTRRSSAKFRDTYGKFKGRTECTPARGADSGGASRFFPVFRYEPKADSAERPRVNGVAHPTVKPLALMRWLVRLVTPPGGVVLDPFAGSGTTAEACVLEGFRCVTVEREAVYLPLIVARLSKPLQPVLTNREVTCAAAAEATTRERMS